MASGGFGRGGRGAALLQALKDPVRKPGSQEDEQKSTVQQTQAEQVPAIPLGRGDLLRGLLAARSVPPPTPAGAAGQTTTTTVQAPSIARGRGLAAMQALLQSTGRGAKPPATPAGQTPQQQAPIVEQQQRSPPRAGPVSPSAQSDGTSSSTQQLEGRFSRMAMEERSDTVTRIGNNGKPISLSGNYIRINCANPGVYQYHVDFRPMVDSKNIRFKLLNEHRDVIGNVKAFDGNILYLPIRLPNQETVVKSTRLTDDAEITLTIRLTRVVPPESCLMVYNIIFRRYVKGNIL